MCRAGVLGAADDGLGERVLGVTLDGCRKGKDFCL